MEINSSFQEATLTWLATTDRNSRLDFIKQCITECNLEETTRVLAMAATAKGRRKRDLDKAEKGKAEAKSSTSTLKTDEASAPASTALCAVAPAAEAPDPLIPWWLKGKKKIIAMDCEMVSLNQLDENGKHISRAATVGIVDFEGNVVYSGRVKHEKNTFIVNKWTRAVNGFEHDSFLNGTPFDEVKREVKRHITNCIIVTVAGHGDFKCLDMEKEKADYDIFDLQSFYQEPSGTISRETKMPNYQPIGLSRIHKYYFGAEVPRDNKGWHNAVKDAEATIRVFREAYIPYVLKNGEVCNRFYSNYDDFENI